MQDIRQSIEMGQPPGMVVSFLLALHDSLYRVRTNHIHTVVTAVGKKSSAVLGAFKANGTDQLRKEGLWNEPRNPWADGGSKRKLWNEKSVARAIDYVLNGQGDELPDFGK